MKKGDNSRLKRRDFLLLSWVAVSIGLVWQAANAMFNYLKPKIQQGSFGAKVIAGRVEEFEPGTVNHIQKGRFYISRLDDGGFLAIWQRCTHLGCTVPWLEERGIFNCPCHSSIFDISGENISGPAPRPLDLFPLEIVENVIIVDTANAIERLNFNSSQVTYM